MKPEQIYDAIYARQSVFKPDSISVDDQIEKARKFAGDVREIVTYQDRGYTGANTQRPDFQRMMADIKAGQIKRVIVWKLDRISRSVSDFSNMLNIFKEYNVEFASVEEPNLTISDAGFGKAMLSIIMIFAELERDNIQTRIRENYYSRLEMGMLGGGPAPFGFIREPYEISGKKCYWYVEDPATSSIVKEMFKKYGEEGCSLRDISYWLDQNGIRTSLGNYWSSATISRMMKNPAFVKADAKVYRYFESKGVHLNNPIDDYIGENGVYLYGERKIKGSTRKKARYADMSADYATLAPHQGLIESDLWLAVQLRLGENKQFGSGEKSNRSWLTGVAKCAYCGKAIIFKRNQHYPIYVSCMGRQNKFCYDRKKVLRVETLEAIVEEYLLGYIKSLPVKTERQRAKFLPEINAIEIEITKVSESINHYMEQLEFADGALVRYINGKVNELDRKRQELSAKLTRLNVDAAKPLDGGFDLDDVVANWETFDIEKKNIVAKTFIQKVIVGDDDIKVILKGGGSGAE